MHTNTHPRAPLAAPHLHPVPAPTPLAHGRPAARPEPTGGLTRAELRAIVIEQLG